MKRILTLIPVLLATACYAASPKLIASAAQAPSGPYVALAWTASPTGGVTYNPYRTTVANGTACPTALSSYTQLTTGVGAVAYNDTTATNVGVYCYVVTAGGGGLESGPSNSVSVTISPQPPTGLTATSH